MAIFHPSIEKIKQFKVQPTDGERALLNFLYQTLDNSFEVFFNPYLNGDRPDVLIMRKGYGVMIIEVKDWNLANFKLDDKKKWVFIPNNSVVKSPINQVLKYKSNLYDLHVNDLLYQKIKDDDIKYQRFLYYNIDLLGYDTLNKEHFTQILKKRYLISKNPSQFFTDALYDNFSRLLSPPLHMKSQGVPYSYSAKQKEIIYSTQLEQRVRGVFGSGKTTVLAARAVQAYKRALERNNNPRILILTFNITLKNFIHDKLNRVNEEFPFENFTIINYHQFINAELNNLGIEIQIPEKLKEQPKDLSRYLEQNYYGNIKLFEEHKNEICKYDAVLIDEIQDYHRSWMNIIKNYFRDTKGDYVLFGDVKQNIYGQPTEAKDVVTNVRGVNVLKYCYRSDFKVRDLAQSFQKNIFGEKYDIDDFIENGGYEFFGQRQEKEGYINYMFLSDKVVVSTLYNIIRGNILNKAMDISPNDITVLGYTAQLLRLFDAYYRYASHERTNSMIETIETMYMTHLNYIDRKDTTNPNKPWFDNISEHLAKKLFPRKGKLYINDIIKLRQIVAHLFTLYDLTQEFKNVFDERLSEECIRHGISYEAFLDFRKHHESRLSDFQTQVYSDNYKNIRDNKKLHFWMNNGTIKISTINSFKGWESDFIFLILEPKYENSTTFNFSFDELLYTGITRCRRNLVIINFGNKEYNDKIRPLIDSVK